MNNIDVNDDIIDLRELLAKLNKRKKFISIFVFITTLVSEAISFSMPNKYTSSVLISPMFDENRNSTLSSSLGGLASLTGVSLSDDRVSKPKLAIEVLKSRKFFKNLDSKYNLLPDLMALDYWDSEKNTLIYDERKYNVKKNTWSLDAKGTSLKPSLQKSHKIFLDHLTVAQDTETSLINIYIEHKSPLVAQEWLSNIVFEINEVIKNEDIMQAQRSIDYLKTQVTKTDLSDLQSSLYDLIQAQIQTIMIAEASPEYVFSTVDPALVPEKKSSPQRVLITLVGFFVGLILSIVISFFWPIRNTQP